MEATPKGKEADGALSFTSRGASHCDHETFFEKPSRDKNLAAASSK